MALDIQRTGGPWPANRYGVILKSLPRFLRRFLVTNRQLAKLRDEHQAMDCILKMQRHKSSTDSKIYWDLANNRPLNERGLEQYYNQIDWQCAISLKPIKAKFMNFDLENFVHPEYRDVLKAPMVDSRILKSSVDFRQECKKLLLEQRQEFLKLAKKNAKRRL